MWWAIHHLYQHTHNRPLPLQAGPDQSPQARSSMQRRVPLTPAGALTALSSLWPGEWCLCCLQLSLLSSLFALVTFVAWTACGRNSEEYESQNKKPGESDPALTGLWFFWPLLGFHFSPRCWRNWAVKQWRGWAPGDQMGNRRTQITAKETHSQRISRIAFHRTQNRVNWEFYVCYLSRKFTYKTVEEERKIVRQKKSWSQRMQTVKSSSCKYK